MTSLSFSPIPNQTTSSTLKTWGNSPHVGFHNQPAPYFSGRQEDQVTLQADEGGESSESNNDNNESWWQRTVVKPLKNTWESIKDHIVSLWNKITQIPRQVLEVGPILWEGLKDVPAHITLFEQADKRAWKKEHGNTDEFKAKPFIHHFSSAMLMVSARLVEGLTLKEDNTEFQKTTRAEDDSNKPYPNPSALHLYTEIWDKNPGLTHFDPNGESIEDTLAQGIVAQIKYHAKAENGFPTAKYKLKGAPSD